ncbi:MAG: hypothetical protein MJ016_02455 [Victivallaceae bacterium]|nr:hypothetical protein [Victivallaceae bacterium]
MKTAKKLFLSMLFAAGVCTFASTEIVVEAEDFATPGDWQSANYASATILMGGKIGAIAKTTFKAEPGDYYVFVRAMTHGGGFRYAEISVNSRKLGQAGDEPIGEDEKAGWHWVPLKKKIRLNAENNTIKMIAHSDYTRIDRILFSTDKDFDCSKAPAPVVSKDRKISGRELEGIFPRPKPEGDGPDMLLLSGGRPWLGNGHYKHFTEAGYRVMVLNSVYLDGCGGASIKITPSDPVEPKPLDGITPEFKDLGKYKIVVFDSMPADAQEKLFTPERVEALKKFVSDGGSVVFSVNVPERLGDLLPVQKQAGADSMEEYGLDGAYAERPETKPFATLPEKWDLYTYFRVCEPRGNAKVLSYICGENGTRICPYIVEMPYGKGKTLFWNAQYERLTQAVSLFTWAHTPTLVAALAETVCPDAKVDAANFYNKVIAAQKEELHPETLDACEAAISEPVFSLEANGDEAIVQGDEIVFANGAKVKIAADKKSVDLYFPGAAKPYVRNFRLPNVGYPAKADKVDSLETAEAVGTKKEDRASKAVWSIVSVAGGKEATIKVSADDGSAYTWTIKTGGADVDGRKFTGFGHQVTLDTMPSHLLSSINFEQKVDVGNKNFRRFACYEPPRGYKNYDLSGKTDVNTRSLSFFSSAQPFSWVEGSDAVFSEFVETPAPTSLAYTMKKNDDAVTGKIIFSFGRVKAPQSTPVFWQMVSDAKYNTTNDWIAMYQFQRKMLRAKAGFPEVAAQPNACNRDTCTDAEQVKCMDYAAAHGFKLYALNFCPAPMESFENPHKRFNDCKERNLAGYPWFPCCHSPDKTRTVVEHPEWYLKDENGQLSQYFGHFYIGDMNNEEFMKWHLGLVDFMMQQGMKTVWYDMGGSASGGVNFATPESPIAFWNQMKLFHHYYENGGWVVTEGMNPCVVDGYIFRENVYNEPVGNEFCMIGAQVNGGGFRCPFFRLAMYDVFFPLSMDPVALHFEKEIGLNDKLLHALSFVPAINDVLAQGMPFIRETAFGTTWITPKGGAVFCWNGVKDLQIRLPEGTVADYLVCNGKTVKLDGKLPASVEPETLIVLKKK